LTVCKRKKSAEGEVLTFVAAIVANWDKMGVNDTGAETQGFGKHPGHKRGTGAVVPALDVRVKISRRR